MFAGGVDGGTLGVDGGDGVQDNIRAEARGFLLLFEQGEHFAILLQFVAKGLNQFLECCRHRVQ